MGRIVTVTERPGPKARAWVERDEAVVSPSYTRAYPFVIARGEGAVVWDVDGNSYIDLNAGIAVCSTGHSHPKVVRAIQEQAARFLHMSSTDFYVPNQVELAEWLAEIAPWSGPARVFFTNSGTEAVEAAMKLARYVTRRPAFIAFYGAFHGRTFGSLSLTASKAVQRARFAPLLPQVYHAHYPNPYRSPLGVRGDAVADAALDYLEEEVLGRLVDPQDVAAIVIEPIQGEGGYVVPPPTFFPRLRELCDRHGILLIADEVQSGMGRTGRWFAIEHFGVEPDIVTVAKGIGSGMPIGAMIARAELMTWTPGAHASTFGGNPVAVAAALATLQVIEEEGLMENAAVQGAYLMERLRAWQERFPFLGDVRGKGLMVGAELVEDRESRRPAKELAGRVLQEAFKEGVLALTAGASTLRFSPPLVIDRETLDEALEVLERVLERVAATG